MPRIYGESSLFSLIFIFDLPKADCEMVSFWMEVETVVPWALFFGGDWRIFLTRDCTYIHIRWLSGAYPLGELYCSGEKRNLNNIEVLRNVLDSRSGLLKRGFFNCGHYGLLGFGNQEWISHTCIWIEPMTRWIRYSEVNHPWCYKGRACCLQIEAIISVSPKRYGRLKAACPLYSFCGLANR